MSCRLEARRRLHDATIPAAHQTISRPKAQQDAPTEQKSEGTRLALKYHPRPAKSKRSLRSRSDDFLSTAIHYRASKTDSYRDLTTPTSRYSAEERMTGGRYGRWLEWSLERGFNIRGQPLTSGLVNEDKAAAPSIIYQASRKRDELGALASTAYISEDWKSTTERDLFAATTSRPQLLEETVDDDHGDVTFIQEMLDKLQLDEESLQRSADDAAGSNGRHDKRGSGEGMPGHDHEDSSDPAPTAWQSQMFRPTPSLQCALRMQARRYHTTPSRQQQAAAAVQASDPLVDISTMPAKKFENPHGIRAQLRRWQEVHGREEVLHDNINLDPDPDTGGAVNSLTRLPDGEALREPSADDEEEREAMAHFMQSKSEEPGERVDGNARVLQMGDLVELEYTKTERESIVAVFIRRTGMLAQFYTMQGRWLHRREKYVQYSIPGWMAPDLIRPLLDHLPDPKVVEENLDTLLEEAYIQDLNVPRHVAAPVVTRMVQFHTESLEIYRKHANTLDNAHNLLAHDSDLRYGSLVSVATMLLKIPPDKLPVTALFAVRQALSHAGFAFNIDRRSHRLTGYLQIRSKEQVKMVEQVRTWLREWQDDLADRATLTEPQLRRHRSTRGAEHVYGFLEKAKQIITKSRENREPTPYGSVGPSKVKLPITPTSDSIRITSDDQFTEEERELVRFMESWSLIGMFSDLPRILALPPLILQATKLYEGYEFQISTGLLFLQELGTIMPYENRVRSDQHLLLPSSQHSKPLQNLMSSILAMAATTKDFPDSMAELRHDWGQLPVYCIDDAGAHEIDDGISLERIGSDSENGKSEWWVHAHIANPTAFFSRDHPLAKMARHMGESIYMPERTYMMLPRWATQRHFSLTKDRPCLTFSARLNDQGEVLERNIRSGTVRNVVRLTRGELGKLLGLTTSDQLPETVFTVGGEPPPARWHKSDVRKVTPAQVEDLQVLRRLTDRRQDIRKTAGGLFFDMQKPDVKVWSSYKNTGLGWDNPHRMGSRTVEGDPVIQMRTVGFTNWFAASNDPVNVLVREMMLLACETAATWCSARQIPAVFRGSVARPDKMNPDVFFREILAPAVKQTEDGQYPMHLGLAYLETFGSTQLSTTPFKHKILGMDYYGKVTSPLRRYGDMILHWQIEAALREEARTGKSLVTQDPNAARDFLPFNPAVLNTIMVGLQPREHIIMRAKSAAENFWVSLLLFRAHHFGETELPKTLRAYCHSSNLASSNARLVTCVCVEVNMLSQMRNPELLGLTAAKQGDTWECEIEKVDVYYRNIILTPLRLLSRMEE